MTAISAPVSASGFCASAPAGYRVSLRFDGWTTRFRTPEWAAALRGVDRGGLAAVHVESLPLLRDVYLWELRCEDFAALEARIAGELDAGRACA